ncbi:MAG: tetratricopeptide repeat protein [Pseudomonadota bacterium]|nr:tetratricopeptide repeat protein [Pseudomonadota bacterium]
MDRKAAATPLPGLLSTGQTLPPLVRPAAVYGKDTRGPVPDRHAAIARSVGRLGVQGRGWSSDCSAFCVAPDIVATAAHCLLYPRPGHQRPKLSQVKFTIGQGRDARETKIAGESEQLAQWNVVGGSTLDSELVGLNNAFDWALARLAAPVCAGRSLKVSPQPKWPDLFYAVASDRVFMVAYHAYRNELLLRFSDKCQVEESPSGLFEEWSLLEQISADPDRLLLHKCDLSKGASGSPLLLEQSEGPVVVGLNVAEGTPDAKQPAIRKRRRDLTKEESAAIDALLKNNMAVSAAAFEKQIELLGRAHEPMPGEKLAELQALLKDTGDYGGAVDGVYGPGTRQALLNFERRRGLLPTGRPAVSLIIAAYIARAGIHADGGKYENAAADYDNAIEIDPNAADSYYKRGNFYRLVNQTSRAIADFDKAIMLDPGHAPAYLDRGNMLFNKGDGDPAENVDRAIADYDRAIAGDPNFIDAYLQRGLAYEWKGAKEKAIEDFRRALDLAPGNSPAFSALTRLGVGPWR